jgi:hypothetical protein
VGTRRVAPKPLPGACPSKPLARRPGPGHHGQVQVWPVGAHDCSDPLGATAQRDRIGADACVQSQTPAAAADQRSLLGQPEPPGLSDQAASRRPPLGRGARQPPGVAHVCFLRMRSSAWRCRLDPGGSRLRPQPSARRPPAARLLVHRSSSRASVAASGVEQQNAYRGLDPRSSPCSCYRTGVSPARVTVSVCARVGASRCIGTYVPTSTETPIERGSVTRRDGQGVNRGNGSGSRASPSGGRGAALP